MDLHAIMASALGAVDPGDTWEVNRDAFTEVEVYTKCGWSRGYIVTGPLITMRRDMLMARAMRLLG